jgi:hypothetical protein
MNDILYLIHNTSGYNNNWKEIETSPYSAKEHQFPGVYFTLITKDNLKTEDLYGYEGDILIFSKKLLEQENYHINIKDYNGFINEENTYFPWNIDKAVKIIKQKSKKGYDIGNEVIFHDNIPMKYLCLVINVKSIDYNIANKNNCKLTNIILPQYEIYNTEEPDKTKIPFYCYPYEDNYTGIGKLKMSSDYFYKKMAILCNVNQKQPKEKIIEEIKEKMIDLYKNREKQKLKEYKLIF